MGQKSEEAIENLVMLFLRFALLVVLLWPGLAVSAGPETLTDGGTFRVVEVVDGDTVKLSDGRQVRFVGIQAPKLPLGRPNFPAWPLGVEAKALVEDLVLDQEVKLHLAPTPQDRHRRVLAHLSRAADGLWLQAELLKRGLARVYTFPDNRVLGDELLAFERQARADKQGIWGLPYYTIRTPENVRHDMGTFQLVEGRVFDVAHVKNSIYLNFAMNWRKDFTIQIDAKRAPDFEAKGIDLLKLRAKRVRVRGWVKSRNGPLILLDHPERLEILY
ncbi:thermonuclease family protein [Magnetovibrio sp. PR-2]|uniref:thermonuclease family protein n=1 Tax=Magnetovibrio sp. PR-2 TaxID=3120356 RepID=UPI002FCE41B5